MIAGVGMLVLAMLLAKVIPRTVVVAFIVGLVLLAPVNSEDRSAFLAVPLGLAWVFMGIALWPGAGRRAAWRGRTNLRTTMVTLLGSTGA